MIDTVDIENCCLCGNCIQSCPKDAISFSKEENLFLYPIIDNNKCINCNLCESVCPAINTLNQNKLLKAYAVKNRDKQILKQSTSGGVFSALAMTVISDGGIVYGAAFDEKLQVRHIAVDDVNNLYLLRVSKYVQSDLNNVFSEIKNHLKNGKEILFLGTPCQSAALNTYLNKTIYYGKLYIVDFICHGILSQNLFNGYIKHLENKYKSKIIDFKFREKFYNWYDSGPEILLKNGKKKHWALYEDLYMQGYFKAVCMRENCYNCKYKDFHSGSDLTMADFWGIENIEHDFMEKMGVSALCVQSDKGLDLLNRSSNMLELREVNDEDIIKYNKGLVMPFAKSPKSKEFFEYAKKAGYITALKKYNKISFVEKLRRWHGKIVNRIRK